MAEIGSCMFCLAQYSANQAKIKAKVCQMRETGGQKQATARYVSIQYFFLPFNEYVDCKSYLMSAIYFELHLKVINYDYSINRSTTEGT